MIKSNLINYLMKNSGELPKGETWYSVGIKFNIKAPDKKRAKKDNKYKKKAIGRETQRVWENYLRQKNKLELSKETYVDGELKTEIYKAVDNTEIPIDYSEYEIEAFTTNGPGGKPWLKGKKKPKFHNEEHYEKLKEILTKEIEPLEYNFDKSYKEKALFIYGADKHIGALTKKNSIYTNLYTKEEIIKRLIYNVLEEIENWVDLNGTFESLYIIDLGDALDGFNQKTTGGLRGTSNHVLPQQFNNREQNDIYVEVHKKLFDEIVRRKYAKNIYFIATCNSNHGGDFEYSSMRHVETYLNIKYPFIKTEVNAYPFNHFIYGVHAIVFGHGKDDEDMKNGLPLYLTDKVDNYFSDYITNNGLTEKAVSVISADLHQASEGFGKNLRYVKVLSQYGSSKWMHTNFGSGKAGLTSEVYLKNKNKIYRTNEFFNVEKSNTGIKF